MGTAKEKEFGDFSAARLDEVAQRYYPGLLRRLFRATKSEDEAADLAQTAFVSLVQRIRSGGRIENPLGYLVQAAWKAWTKCRRDRRTAARCLQGYTPDAGVAASREEAGPETEFIERVRAALERLPANHRASLELAVQRGLSYDEAARAMGASRDTAAKWRCRGLDRLRRELVGKADAPRRG
jgi:RNA polymerase sigma factor (sigma-70 family)